MTEAQCSNWSRPKTYIVGTLSFSEISWHRKAAVCFFFFVIFNTFKVLGSLRTLYLKASCLNRQMCFITYKRQKGMMELYNVFHSVPSSNRRNWINTDTQTHNMEWCRKHWEKGFGRHGSPGRSYVQKPIKNHHFNFFLDYNSISLLAPIKENSARTINI